MVVVGAGPGLVAGDGPHRLDAPDQAGVGQRAPDAGPGLGRHAGEGPGRRGAAARPAGPAPAGAPRTRYTAWADTRGRSRRTVAMSDSVVACGNACTAASTA